jgi:tetratricopeptide (TPR) repeat protein
VKTISAEPAEARVLEVLDGYLAELRAGRAPDRKALLAKHPDLAESLAASFRALDFVHDAGRTLEAPAAPPGREEPASAGRMLGDYRLLREIGRGGMAVVYEAEQVSLGRHVALKVLPFAAVLDPKHLQRFKNEAQAAAHLHHPHIVPVHAVGCERGVHYYAMQYVEGQSLAVAIREMKGGGAGEGPRTPISSHGSNREPAYIRMAAALGVQAAEALDHAHQLGVVHRDVKPGNLLVDLAGTLWVTDFGLASSKKDVGLTITGELLGTIRYMSPEQALAKRVPVDHRTDVYSLGATLYELFTLEPAFPGDDPHVVIQDIAFKEPALPRRLNPALPRDLETVLLKAMWKDPAGRYATAQEMADDLGRFLENRPIEARRPGLLRRATKWGRRHRAVVAAAAGMLLLAVAGLVIGTALLWREQKQTKRAFDRAEWNLALALKALDQIYVDGEVDGDTRLREGLPRDLLERGVGFYEEFARANEHNQGVALSMGNAYRRTSLIYRELGQKDRADAALDRAVSICREVVHREPDNFDAQLCLGCALFPQKDHDGAIHAYGQAIRLKPNHAEAHLNLGNAYLAKGDTDRAITSYGAALRVRPEYAVAHYNLANVFKANGDLEAAIASYGRAIRARPDYFPAHANLGEVLLTKGEPDAAIPAIKEALRLRPNLVSARVNLGSAFDQKGDHDGAIREYQEAIQLKPDCFDAFYNLGCSYLAQGDWTKAISALQEVIRHRADDAEAHCNLSHALAGQGRHREALPFLRKGHELGSKQPGWAYPSKKWLEEAEQKALWEERLDRLLSGEARPTDAIERIAFADLLYAKSRHAESARMYAEAFAEDTALAEDLAKGHRYDAACSAALAAAPGGADAAEWRGRALEWLRGDLAAREKAPSGLVATLEHWKGDPDLAGVRDRLGDLPEPEREAWQGLWTAVDEALATAR